MRYSLRTLLIVMLLGGPALAGAWQKWEAWRASQDDYDQRLPPCGCPPPELYNPWYADDGTPRDEPQD